MKTHSTWNYVPRQRDGIGRRRAKKILMYLYMFTYICIYICKYKYV